MIQKDKIEHIANITNLAVTTVKRFFYEPEKLHVETFRTIISVLAKHYPEELRKIAENDYRDILLIFPDNELMIISDIINILQKLALKYNFDIRLYENKKHLSLNKLIEINKKKWINIRGIITLGTIAENVPEDFLVPTVFINNMQQQPYGVNIDVNDYLGGRLAIKHLHDNLWERPAFVTYEYFDKPSKERYNGVRTECENLNIECKIIKTTDFSMEETYLTTKKILSNENIDSIFYFCDQMAIGGMRAINDYGYKIGKDIGVIGFDNLVISKFLDLSSMDQGLYEKLSYSVEYILFGNGKYFDEKLPLISYSPEVVIRKSSIKTE